MREAPSREAPSDLVDGGTAAGTARGGGKRESTLPLDPRSMRSSTLPIDPITKRATERRGSKIEKVEKKSVSVVTEVSDFVGISIVKFHLRKKAVTQGLYQIVISLYMLNALSFSGKITDIQGFQALASDILFAAFYLPRARASNS